MNYYVKPWGRTALFIAKNPAGNVVDKIETKAQGLEPHVLKGASSGYPSYEIISVRGVTEVIEHRRIEPVFYVADDPAVLKELGIK